MPGYKDEHIKKLKQIINRLIYSNWDLDHPEDKAYILYAPYRIGIECKGEDKLTTLQDKFKKKICEIEEIEEI